MVGSAWMSALLDSLDSVMTCAVAFTAMALAGTPLADLTVLQWRTLVVAEHGVRVGALAEALGVSFPSASKLVKRLVSRGYVVLVRDEVDSRVRVVTVTPEGALLREQVREHRRRLFATAIEDLEVTISEPCAREIVKLGAAVSDIR